MPSIEEDLYRSVRKETFTEGVVIDGEPAAGLLYGDIDPRTIIIKGKKTVRQDWQANKNGYFKTGSGTSLWNVKGVFGETHWFYFRMPAGTSIPATLKIVKGDYSAKFNATHFQIEVANGGTLTADALRGALSTLARNCLAKAAELGISVK